MGKLLQRYGKKKFILSLRKCNISGKMSREEGMYSFCLKNCDF
jgi:hypothetical protein